MDTPPADLAVADDPPSADPEAEPVPADLAAMLETLERLSARLEGGLPHTADDVIAELRVVTVAARVGKLAYDRRRKLLRVGRQVLVPPITWKAMADATGTSDANVIKSARKLGIS